MQSLLRMSRAQLDDLFSASRAGAIPHGPARGLALILPATALAGPIARSVEMLAWKGKTFDAPRGRLTNRVTPFGINAIVATVYEAPSRFDGRPCIVLDYSKTSLVARPIRDEIRTVAPRLYLGKVYFLNIPVFGFALAF